MTALVSVIMPVYNVEPYLEKAVESVRDQTYHQLEIILVDDGATDGSGELCDILAGRDTRIQVVHQSNAGVAAARNHGVQFATGDYLLFIDSDDYLAPNMIEVLLNQMLATGADVSCCNIMNVYTNAETPQFDQPDFYQVMDRREFVEAYLIGQKVPGSISNKLLRHSIVKDLKFPGGRLYEDAFYHFELMQVTSSYVVCGRPLYYYFHRSNSLTTQPFNASAMDCVAVYQQFYQWVKATYPALEQAAFFRLAHAYFTAFDRLLLLENYRQHAYYNTLLNFLRKHSGRIARNSFFRTGRRLASLALVVSVSLYRALLMRDIQQHKGINTHDEGN